MREGAKRRPKQSRKLNHRVFVDFLRNCVRKVAVSNLLAMPREEEDRHCEPELAGAAIQEKHLNHRIFVNFFWIASLALRRPTRNDVFLRGNLKTKIIVDNGCSHIHLKSS